MFTSQLLYNKVSKTYFLTAVTRIGIGYLTFPRSTCLQLRKMKLDFFGLSLIFVKEMLAFGIFSILEKMLTYTNQSTFELIKIFYMNDVVDNKRFSLIFSSLL